MENELNDDFVGDLVAEFVRLLEAADLESELPPPESLEDHCLPGSVIAMAMFDYLLKHKPAESGPEWDQFLKEALQESINADIAKGSGKRDDYRTH